MSISPAEYTIFDGLAANATGSLFGRTGVCGILSGLDFATCRGLTGELSGEGTAFQKESSSPSMRLVINAASSASDRLTGAIFHEEGREGDSVTWGESEPKEYDSSLCVVDDAWHVGKANTIMSYDSMKRKVSKTHTSGEEVQR